LKKGKKRIRVKQGSACRKDSQNPAAARWSKDQSTAGGLSVGRSAVEHRAWEGRDLLQVTEKVAPTVDAMHLHEYLAKNPS